MPFAGEKTFQHSNSENCIGFPKIAFFAGLSKRQVIKTAKLIFSTRKGRITFKILTSNGHLLIQETNAKGTRSYRINKAKFDYILTASNSFEAARNIYHQSRLEKKARRQAREKGEHKNGSRVCKLVSAFQTGNGE